MPSGHKTSDVPSKYQPLFDLLAAATGDEITLTYREIGATIGAPLPPSAVLSSGWWTATRLGHVAGWRAIGWRARTDRNNARVRFVRLATT